MNDKLGYWDVLYFVSFSQFGCNCFDREDMLTQISIWSIYHFMIRWHQMPIFLYRFEMRANRFWFCSMEAFSSFDVFYDSKSKYFSWWTSSNDPSSKVRLQKTIDFLPGITLTPYKWKPNFQTRITQPNRKQIPKRKKNKINQIHNIYLNVKSTLNK